MGDVHADQAVGLTHAGRRPHEQRVGDAEDRRRGPDTQRDRQGGDGSEAGRSAEQTYGVAEVLDERLHRMTRWLSVAGSATLRMRGRSEFHCSLRGWIEAGFERGPRAAGREHDGRRFRNRGRRCSVVETSSAGSPDVRAADRSGLRGSGPRRAGAGDLGAHAPGGPGRTPPGGGSLYLEVIQVGDLV